MGKNRDLVGILLIVIIGIFIPLLGSIALTYGFDFTKIDEWLRIGSIFGYFLLIFAFELIFVYLYFYITNRIASKKINRLKPKP